MKLIKPFRFREMKENAGKFLIYGNRPPFDIRKTTWMGRMKAEGKNLTLNWSGWREPKDIIKLGSFEKLRIIKTRGDAYPHGSYVLDAKTFKKAKEELEQFLVMEAL